jgi:hypothetical protein
MDFLIIVLLGYVAFKVRGIKSALDELRKGVSVLGSQTEEAAALSRKIADTCEFDVKK